MANFAGTCTSDNKGLLLLLLIVILFNNIVIMTPTIHWTAF